MEELATLVRTVGEDAGSFTIGHAFSLEHGARAIGRHFAQVERRDYPDALEVTDPDAIVRYVASTIGADAMIPDRMDRLRAIVTDAIANTGSFHVSKATGLFIASGTPDPT